MELSQRPESKNVRSAKILIELLRKDDAPATHRYGLQQLILIRSRMDDDEIHEIATWLNQEQIK